MKALAMLGMRWRVSLFGTVERLMKRYSLVGDEHFFDTRHFSWVEKVEAATPLIVEELNAVLKHQDAIPNFQDISSEQMLITNDALWKTFFFYTYGRKMSENCATCPKTSAVLRQIPGLTTAFFSILLPNKVIPVHRGPYAGVLRYHLGLKIPTQREACGIEVGGTLAHWEQGKSLIFDDTFMHKAWNQSEQIRVVLFVDFRRPLRFPFSLLNRIWIYLISLSPFIKGMVQRQDKWDRVFQDAYRKAEK